MKSVQFKCSAHPLERQGEVMLNFDQLTLLVYFGVPCRTVNIILPVQIITVKFYSVATDHISLTSLIDFLKKFKQY